MSTEANIVEDKPMLIEMGVGWVPTPGKPGNVTTATPGQYVAEIERQRAEITKLRAERDAAVENVLAVIDPWTRGAFTGWAGKTYRSRITLDRAEDHFTECMRDMKDDVRAKLTGAPAVIATDGKDAT